MALPRKVVARRKRQRVARRELLLSTILKNKTKRARLVLLLCAIILLCISFFLPAPGHPKPEDTATSYQEPAVGDSFSSEPVIIDKKLLNPARKTPEKSPPEHIIIPAVGIDLVVKPARVLRGYWEVFPDSAGFGTGSSYPGESGNQVIFAHARRGLFEPLPKLKIGDTIYIFAKASWFKYQVAAKKEVMPKDVEVIAPTEEETLTLYTCSGFADSKRLIVTARRIKN